MRHIFATLSLMALNVFPCYGQHGWEAIGPYAGNFSVFASSASAPSTVYAAFHGNYLEPAVFKSTDGGRHWIGLAPLTGQSVYGRLGNWVHIRTILVDPNDSSTVYLAGDGLIKSTDGGNAWINARNGIPTTTSIGDAVLDPTNSSILYVTTGLGVYKSTDGAVSWHPSNVGLTGIYNDSNSAIAIDQMNGSLLLAGYRSALFKSADAGGHWTRVEHPECSWISSIQFDLISEGTAYVAAGSCVLRSKDYGSNWEKVENGFEKNTYVDSIAVAVTEPLVLAMSRAGLYCSVDHGATWALKKKSHNPEIALSPHSAVITKSGSIFAGFNDRDSGPSRPFKSVNKGTSWIELEVPGAGVSQIRFNPQRPRELLVGTFGDGVYWTGDAGISWEHVGVKDGILSVALTNGSQNAMFIGTRRGIFRSADHGKTWSPAEGGPANQVWGISASPDEQHIMIAASADGIFKSVDAGLHWARTNFTQTGNAQNAYSILFNGGKSDSIIVGTGAGIVSSSNGGISWDTLPLQSTSAVASLSQPTSKPNVIYGGCYAGTLGVQVTYDGGKTWAGMNNGLSANQLYVHSVLVDPRDPNKVYRATFGAGIWYSPDAGLSWQDISAGLPVSHVESLAIEGDFLYAGTGGAGVYRKRIR